MSSFREINYTLRPAKATERRMLGEAFRRLYPFERVENYRYIGFGSIYFSDFQVVHRALGIDDMVSIERDTAAKACFEFNKPFRSIDLKFGEAADILPALTWDRRSIVWLDYDGRLDTAVLSDIGTFCTSAPTGSALVVSVNAQPDPEPNEEGRKEFEQKTGVPFDAGQYRLAKLEEQIPGRVPLNTVGKDLRKNGVAAAFYRAIINQIEEQLSVRNSTLSNEKRFFWRQFAHFLYKDNALMFTVGFMIVSEEERPLFDACSFDGLSFVRTGADPYTIRVPCLTGKEIQHLNAQLPTNSAKPKPTCPGVSEKDIDTYSEVYRYFPNFSEIMWT
jgi:hypothetical protein